MSNQIIKIENNNVSGDMTRVIILEDETYLEVMQGEYASMNDKTDFSDFVESKDSVVFQKVKINGSTELNINGMELTPFMKKTLLDFLIQSI